MKIILLRSEQLMLLEFQNVDLMLLVDLVLPMEVYTARTCKLNAVKELRCCAQRLIIVEDFVKKLRSTYTLVLVESSNTSDSNTPVLSSTGLKCSTTVLNLLRNIKTKYLETYGKWKPTGRTFTIVGNSWPLTRITSANIVALKKTTSHSVETQKQELKVVQNGLWYLDSGCSKHMTGNRSVHELGYKFPRLKFQKDHLCSACALGKSKKSSHQPKAEDTNQEKLCLLHMDLCGLMRVVSINGKRYILVIVDDYSRFTWVRFLRTKDEAPEAIIKCIKNIQVCLNATVRNVRTDNGKEFVNQTLLEFYENLTAMASEQFSSGLGLHSMTPATSSSGLVPNPIPQQPCIPPPRDDWDALDAPLTSIPSTQEQEHSPTISQGFEESLKTPTFRDDPLHESLHEESTSQGSSSNVRQIHTPFEHLGRWTKDHPIANIIGNPSHSVSTRKQLQTDAMWCYFDAHPLTFG
ncbi:retrovirus-related pol polyprotein from transposon TNT 1-94 [Tanacetum coccineum]